MFQSLVFSQDFNVIVGGNLNKVSYDFFMRSSNYITLGCDRSSDCQKSEESVVKFGHWSLLLVNP